MRRARFGTRYNWSYIVSTACPGLGVAAGVVLPYADTEAMNMHLTEIASTVAPGAHAILAPDGAGWHGAKALKVPDFITLLPLPPNALELERIAPDWIHSFIPINEAAFA